MDCVKENLGNLGVGRNLPEIENNGGQSRSLVVTAPRDDDDSGLLYIFRHNFTLLISEKSLILSLNTV